jgi:hypothetical protein
MTMTILPDPTVTLMEPERAGQLAAMAIEEGLLRFAGEYTEISVLGIFGAFLHETVRRCAFNQGVALETIEQMLMAEVRELRRSRDRFDRDLEAGRIRIIDEGRS